MGDYTISFVPNDPQFIPSEAAQKRAVAFLEKAFHDHSGSVADSIEATTTQGIEVAMPGEYFDKVNCPACKKDIPDWSSMMGVDYEAGKGFKLARYPMPCCGITLSLNALTYDPHIAFSRFKLEIMNSPLGSKTAQCRSDLEAVLGTPLSVIDAKW
jgi:hypothetical protein